MTKPIEEKGPIPEVLRSTSNGVICGVVRKPLAGEKKGTALPDNELQQWIHGLLDTHYTNEQFAAKVHIRFDTEMPLPPNAIRGNEGTTSPREVSFVYLDVGAWIGSKDKPWGMADKGGDTLKRDFGVICGPLVALCSFKYAFPHDHCAAWQSADKSKEPYKSVDALLKKLSTASWELGEVVVRELVRASSANARWPTDPRQWVIHLVVGDMHVPVLDDIVQSYGGVEKYKPIDMNHLDPNAPLDTPIYDVPYLVPRLGRLTLRPTEELVKTLVGPHDKDGARFVRGVVSLGVCAYEGSLEEQIETAGTVGIVLGLGVAAGAAAGVEVTAAGAAAYIGAGAASVIAAGEAIAVEGRSKRMSKADAELWYKYYCQGHDGGRPADVFEGAGVHFCDFMRGAAQYAEECSAKGTLPVKFLQLGDMLDFWVGFTCHYDPSSNPDAPIVKVDSHAEEMVQHWADNLFGQTKQGQYVAKAIESAKKLSPVYLYGNHDNYLGAITPKLPNPLGGKPIPLDKREPRYNKKGTGLFMEHGHQWEPTNADDSPQIGLAAYILGTPSPLGMLVTQGAFIRPAPVRSVEGEVAGMVARFKGGRGQRLDQVMGAAQRFLQESGRFYCYVMGHTHSACLSQIALSTRHEGSLAQFVEDSKNNPDFGVFFTKNGVPVREQVIHISQNYGPADVRVDWKGLIGSNEHESIAIEYPLTPPLKDPKQGPKGLVLANSNNEKEGHLIFRAAPGLYAARLYIRGLEPKPFKASLNLVAVHGISIEHGPHDSDIPVFEFCEVEKKFLRPIFVKWAYSPAQFDPTAYFAITRAGDSIDLCMANRVKHYPRYQFAELERKTPHYGRSCLSGLHPVSWDFLEPGRSPIGTWIVRAFDNNRQANLIGTATFEIREAKHGKKAR